MLSVEINQFNKTRHTNLPRLELILELRPFVQPLHQSALALGEDEEAKQAKPLLGGPEVKQ